MKIEVVDFGLLLADQKQKIYKLKSENIESFNMDRIAKKIMRAFITED